MTRKTTLLMTAGAALGVAGAIAGGVAWHQHKEAERAEIRAMFQASLPADAPFKYDVPAPAPDYDQAKRLRRALKDD